MEDRILAALEITRRPLGSLELARALALDAKRSAAACQRLVTQGYITRAENRTGESEAAWRLAPASPDRKRRELNARPVA